MSSVHHIDKDEPLFLFNHCPPLKPQSLLEVSSRCPQLLSSAPSCARRSSLSIMSSMSRAVPAQEHSSSILNTEQGSESGVIQGKGKGVFPQTPSEPMSILAGRSGIFDVEVDLFSMSFASAGSSTRTLSPVVISETYVHPVDASYRVVQIADPDGDSPSAVDNKGKGRELPPALPPLSFSPAELLYENADWPSVAGPSSYGSTSSSLIGAEGRTPNMNLTAPLSPPSSPESTHARVRVPSRARSLSNLSVRSRQSISAISMNKVKLKLANSKLSSNLAKKLFKRREDSPGTHASPAFESDACTADPALVEITLSGLDVLGQNSCLIPWSRDMKFRTPLATPVVGTDVVWGSIDPIYRSPLPTDPHPLRTKGRSYSSPLPLPSSPFDIVPTAPADIFAPSPLIFPNYFEELLPHELQVSILAAFVLLHESDHNARIATTKWTAIKAGASRNKWVGRDRGIRELLTLSRVSRSWQALVFDGQLWAILDLHSFPKFPSTIINRLGKTAGAFISSINLAGHTGLTPNTIHDLTTCISVRPALIGSDLSLTHTHTQLTNINLRGCTLLTTHSLHTLLIRSPLLQQLCVKGLTAVTNTTCDILATYCTQLVSLDVGRCPNMSGAGVHALASSALTRGEPTKLKVLRVAGLKRITNEMMMALGRAAPLLEVLDLSGARDLHNSAIEAFVACTEEDSDIFQTISLSSRDAGRDPVDPERVWRRVTRLRHLSLSSCALLTDHACSHLAFAVPELAFLELAGIGPEIRDSGVVRLLSTTPFIRRVDLEDATEITDDVLVALTPTRDPNQPTSHYRTPPPLEPGHVLEQIILSYTDVTMNSLIPLIRKCPRLQVIEADNTRLSGSALREFVSLSQERSILNARIVAIDCRNVGESLIQELAPRTRPRLGWRSWHARKLAYLDGRDAEGLSVGQDELDHSRVVVKTFYSWQTVDAVGAAREKKRSKSSGRRGLNGSSSSGVSDDLSSSGRPRWWSPSGRRSSGLGTPTLLDTNGGDREGCTIM